jgi:hypothetical protein
LQRRGIAGVVARETDDCPVETVDQMRRGFEDILMHAGLVPRELLKRCNVRPRIRRRAGFVAAESLRCSTQIR